MIAADLTHPESPARIVNQTVAGLGGVHILVNNAGAYVRAPAPQADLTEWDTKRICLIRLTGPVWRHT